MLSTEVFLEFNNRLLAESMALIKHLFQTGLHLAMHVRMTALPWARNNSSAGTAQPLKLVSTAAMRRIFAQQCEEAHETSDLIYSRVALSLIKGNLCLRPLFQGSGKG